MANEPYDPETDKRRTSGTSPYDNQTSPGRVSFNRGALRSREASAGTGGGEASSDDTAGDNPDAGGATDSAGSMSPSNIRNREQSGAGRGAIGEDTGGDDEGGKYNSDGDEPTGRLGRARARAQNARSRVRQATSNKWFWGVGLGGSTVLGFLLLLIVLLGSLKVPQLAQHIAEYQFARVARNYSEHSAEITAEDTALSTADRNVLQKAFDKAGQVKDATWGSMYDKINNYRPDKLVENLQESGNLDFKYQSGNYKNLWKKKLTAVVIGGQEIPFNKPSLWKKVAHPIQTRSERLAFSDSANQAIADTFQGRSSIIRGSVAKSIRSQFDIPLKWWRQLDKFNGKNQAAADAEQEAEAAKQINDPNVAPSEVPKISEGAQKAENALQQCLDNPSCVEQTAANGGKLPGPVLEAINSAVSTDVFQKAVSFFNPTYAVGLPLCIIYDGSLHNSSSGQGQAVDNTSTEDQRTFYAVETAANQQQYGDTNGTAVGAMNWKVGDITKTIPEQRAGGIAVNTSNETSPQASGNGDLSNTTSIFSFLPSSLSGVADSAAGPSCQLVTNVWFGAAGAAAALVSNFFSGGTEQIATDGVANSILTYLRSTVGSAASKKEVTKLGIIASGTAALTLYAKMLVAQKAGLADSGLATNSDFDNAADKGGNLNANETARRFYARPLTNAEVCATNSQDQVYLANQAASQSAFERYFAISSPDSLLTRFGIATSSHVNGSMFSSLLTQSGKILSPFSSLAHLFGILAPSSAAAAASNCADNQNYGIIQWGWSKPEEDLITSDASYEPIENQAIIESATYDGQPAMQAITNAYSTCWGYDATGNPDPKATMGKLLTDQDIQRGSNGDVDPNNGLCAPQKLSFNSDDTKAFDNTNGRDDLIFRYRLEKNYELTIDQLESIQNAQTTN